MSRQEFPIPPSPMAAPAMQSGDLLGMLFLRIRTILLVFLGVVLTVTFLVFYLISPTYEAGSTVVINSQDLILPVVEGAPISDVQKLTAFHTQKDILRSSQIASEVVDRLQLTTQRHTSRIERIKIRIRSWKRKLGAQFQIESWQRPEDGRGAAMSALIANMQIEGKPDSQALNLTYTAFDPREAADTVNTLVQVYKAYYNAQVKETASGLTTYLESQLEDVNRQLAVNEQDLLRFKRSDRVNLSTRRRAPTPGASVSIDDQTIPSDPQASEPLSLLGITDSPSVQAEMKLYVLNMEDELRKLLADYTENAPQVIELRDKIRAYTEAINKVPEKELDLVRLKRAYEINQDAAINLRRNLEKAKVVLGADTQAINVIVVLDEAKANPNAIAPKRKLAMTVAVIFGFSLGLIVALIRHYFDHSLRSPRELENYLGIKMLGSLQVIR